MPASNLKQALLPAGSLCLPNQAGTAPGFSLCINNCRFFALPGVPREMKQMFTESVIPWIEESFAHDLQPLTLRVVSCFGITESQTSQALQGFEHSFQSIAIGFRFKFPVIQVRLYSRQQAGEVAVQDMEQAVAWIKQRLGDKVFSCRERSLEEETLQLLKAQDRTLAVLEGCSGGLLAHLTTRTQPGRQALLMARVVQEDLQTVSPELAYPADQVRELAQEIREDARSDFGLATVFEKRTSQAKAWIGLADKQRSLAREFFLGYPGHQANITALAYAALNMLRLKLLGNME
jgi:nicotinamide-nucleotide amidase